MALTRRLRLEYCFALTSGYKMIGSEDGPFALWSEEEKKISVFGSPESVKFSSFKTDCVDMVLDAAFFYGATVRVEAGAAVCELGLIVSSGDDYVEAMLQAIAIQHASGILGPPKPQALRQVTNPQVGLDVQARLSR